MHCLISANFWNYDIKLPLNFAYSMFSKTVPGGWCCQVILSASGEPGSHGLLWISLWIPFRLTLEKNFCRPLVSKGNSFSNIPHSLISNEFPFHTWSHQQDETCPHCISPIFQEQGTRFLSGDTKLSTNCNCFLSTHLVYNLKSPFLCQRNIVSIFSSRCCSTSL